jgi:hypothetical protein
MKTKEGKKEEREEKETEGRKLKWWFANVRSPLTTLLNIALHSRMLRDFNMGDSTLPFDPPQEAVASFVEGLYLKTVLLLKQ